MHEWSLAEAVVAKAAEVARARGIPQVRSVVIGLGELQAVDRDAFTFGLEQFQAREPVLADARMELRVDPAMLACRPCGHHWALGESLATLSEDDREAIHLLPELAHGSIVCPACGSPDFAIEGGRGVGLIAVDG
ncbi:MAG: hydrogenase nickel incorporation protein HypA [Chloroflexota bacterium]